MARIKKQLTADELAAKKLQFAEMIGHMPIWGRNVGNTADATYAIPGRNIVIGVTVDLGRDIPEVVEARFP